MSPLWCAPPHCEFCRQGQRGLVEVVRQSGIRANTFPVSFVHIYVSPLVSSFSSTTPVFFQTVIGYRVAGPLLPVQRCGDGQARGFKLFVFYLIAMLTPVSSTQCILKLKLDQNCYTNLLTELVSTAHLSLVPLLSVLRDQDDEGLGSMSTARPLLDIPDPQAHFNTQPTCLCTSSQRYELISFYRQYDVAKINGMCSVGGITMDNTIEPTSRIAFWSSRGVYYIPILLYFI